MTRNYTCYMGKYCCPDCGSKETGTDTIMTSAEWMDFHCHRCGRDFKKPSSVVSGLSESLHGLAKAACTFMSAGR